MINHIRAIRFDTEDTMVTSAQEKAPCKHLPQRHAGKDRYAITGDDQDRVLRRAFDNWYDVFFEEHKRDPDWIESRKAVRSITTQTPILYGMNEHMAMHRLGLSQAPRG